MPPPLATLRHLNSHKSTGARPRNDNTQHAQHTQHAHSTHSTHTHTHTQAQMFRLFVGVLKTVLAVLAFVAGTCSIVGTQWVGRAVSVVLFQRVETAFTQAWMARTKSSFIVLLSAILAFVSRKPVRVRVTSPNLDRARLRAYTDGSLETSLAQHAVLVANHQIYTDWVFLWYLAQTAGLGGFIYIMLKQELARLPVLGSGMKGYDFIFLTRKWLADKATMSAHLERLDANARGKGPYSGAVADAEGRYPEGSDPSAAWPYHLLIFPEGTNLSANTRGKTEAYAKKVDRKPFKHVLLPKSTGLRFTLLKLQKSVEEVYDITIGYSGVKEDEYGQDIYRLPQVFLHGKNPETVDMHIRVLYLRDIPIGKLEYDDPEEEQKDQKIFEDWLFDVWQQKDDLMDKYYKTGSFIAPGDKVTAKATTTLYATFSQFLQIFVVPGILLIFARIAYIIWSVWYDPAASCAATPAPQPTFVNVFE